MGTPSPRVTSQDRPRAIAVDHASNRWRKVNRYFLESRFGEPPAVLRWENSDFLLTDPPVCLGGGGQWDGDWVDVPAEHATNFDTAVAWARDNVGTSGKAPNRSRPLLVLDDPPPSLSGWDELPLWFLHSRAEHAQVAVHLEFDGSLRHKVVADFASAFYAQLVAGPVSAIGDRASVTYGSFDAEQAWGLVVTGLTQRADGRVGLTKATATSWRQITSKLRAGELTGAMFAFTRTNADGQANMEPFTHQKAEFKVWNELDHESTQLARVLKVSVDLPFFGLVFTPAHAEEIARRALIDLPLRRGYVHVGRWAASTDHWIDIVPVADVPNADGYEVVESHGALAWCKRSAEPPAPVMEI